MRVAEYIIARSHLTAIYFGQVVSQRRNAAANVPIPLNTHRFYFTWLFDSWQKKRILRTAKAGGFRTGDFMRDLSSFTRFACEKYTLTIAPGVAKTTPSPAQSVILVPSFINQPITSTT
jgi:hypothetical protein